VDEDAVDQRLPSDSSGVQEPEEEPDQLWVAVDELDPVRSPMRLVLGAFAPVGDGSGDEDLPVA